MKRLALETLRQWKDRRRRKPLIIRGARQVGKTWLLKTFGKHDFQNYHHFDFERDRNLLNPVFQGDFNPQRIVRDLSLLTNRMIDIKNDLVIFDEIQNIPRAITALKYFQEEMPQLAVCAAGSLLGIALSDVSFPVGKVEFLNLYPMNFEEFLLNYGNPMLYDAYLEGARRLQVPEVVHFRLLEILKEFFAVGGMPEVVATYLEEKDENPGVLVTIRNKQQDLLNTFIADFSKHSGKVNALHISSVFENIPRQLAHYTNDSVKRFRFKDVVKGKKGYTELRGSIDWLENARLIIKVYIVNRPELPLKAFSKENLFKLYLNDVGLLGAILEIPPSAIILNNYGMTRGFFAENFVATELQAATDATLFGWNENQSEVEFLIVRNNQVIPVEVKAGKSTKAKSLLQFIKKYQPPTAIILSERPLENWGGIRRYIPLYYTGKLPQLPL